MSIINVTLKPHGGYTIKLDNGLSISVATNKLAYTTRDDFDCLTHVELACLKTDNGQFFSREVWPNYCQNDDVIGHLPIDKIDTLVQLANDWKE